MNSRDAITYLSGRAVALVLLVAFQIIVVRGLGPSEYATYALVFAVATFVQTVASLGIPRLITKYLTQAGWRLSFATARRLAVALLLVRLASGAIVLSLLAFLGSALGWFAALEPRVLLVGSLFILSGQILLDADAMAQSLGKQRVSRNCVVGEAALRLVLVGWQFRTGSLDEATDVLWFAVVSTSLATSVLLVAVFRTLSQEETVEDPVALDLREVASVAIGGYAGSLAWFASSPAIVRVMASRVLSVPVFAGFAFAQTLVLSFQRYAPSALIFPFFEPAVLRDYARTGDKARLQAALSIVTKLDILVVGAAVVAVSIAGREIVEMMTGGKYGTEAYAIAWVLTYVAATSMYRALEIVAVALGIGAVLVRTLTLSLVWLAVMIGLSPVFGLWVLLVGPVADALSRIAFINDALRRRGLTEIVDLRALAVVVTLAIALTSAAAWLQQHVPDRSTTIALGVVGAAALFAGTLLMKPVRADEAALLSDFAGLKTKWLAPLTRA